MEAVIRKPESLFVVGVNHRTLPVADRELLTRLEKQSGDLLPSIVRECSLNEAALLSTCNRFEVISVAPDGEPASEREISSRIISCLRSRLERPLSDQSFYRFSDAEAIRHVFRVSSSLDSLVMGESQILGQVKDAYERAKQLGFAGKYLHHLFQFAFHLAKKVRTHTGVASGGVSISYAAVRLAEQIFGTLAGRSVMVIGSGRMAELAVLHLRSHGCSRITVVNRTIKRAAELAGRIGGSAVSLHEYEQHLPQMDVVIGSIAIDRPVLDAAAAKRVLGRRPQFFIDLGVPRNFPESIGKIENVYLYTIDDLGSIVEQNRSLRDEAARDAEIIIEYGLSQFQRWLVKVSAEPAILDFRAEVREAIEAEVSKALRDLSPDRRAELVSQISHRVSQRVSHRLTDLLAKLPGGKIEPESLLPLVLDDFFKF